MTTGTQRVGTPKISRRKDVKMGTPKSALKTTILNYGVDDSYVEEEDSTFILDETADSEYSEDDEILDDTEEVIEKLDDTETEVSEDLGDGLRSRGLKDQGFERATAGDSGVCVGENEHSELRKFLVKHEIPRKMLHSSMGFFVLWLYTLGIHQTQTVLPLAVLFTVIFVQDYLRLHHEELNKKIVENWWFLIRESEVKSYNGVLWYLSGLILLCSFAPKDISLVCTLFLSWADTAAATFGRQFGKYTPQVLPGKSVAGTAAAFVTGVISIYVLYGYFVPTYTNLVDVPGDILWTPETSRLSLWQYSLFGGLIASASECLCVYNLDDNFTIPVVSGVLLYGLVRFFQT